MVKVVHCYVYFITIKKKKKTAGKKPMNWASLVAQRLKHLPGMRKSQVQSLGQEDPLEKEMATHSSTLAWRIPWREKPGRLQSMGLQRVGHDWATSLHFTFVKPEFDFILIQPFFTTQSCYYFHVADQGTKAQKDWTVLCHTIIKWQSWSSIQWKWFYSQRAKHRNK